MARLHEHYQKTVVPALMEKFEYSSVMQVPRITKITLNMGVGEAITDKKVMQAAVDEMTRIAGQKPVVTKARKSVAAFKIREGWPIGCKVTLRRKQMYEFLDRLISVAFPRVRDFRGVSPRAFDGRRTGPGYPRLRSVHWPSAELVTILDGERSCGTGSPVG